jgi:hypothetical protein
MLLAVGCATTSARTEVQRAAWIAFKGAKTVAIDVKVSCADVWRGPNLVDKQLVSASGSLGPASASLGISTKVLEERTSVCTDDYADRGRARVLEIMKSHLAREGYQAVEAGSPADQTLSGEITFRRVRSLAFQTEVKDKPEDAYKACAQACGRPVCLQYKVDGYSEMDGHFTGPALPGVDTQTVARQESSSALRQEEPYSIELGERHDLICGPQEAGRLQDESMFNWGKGLGANLAWLDQTSNYMLHNYKEKFDVKLFKVKDCETNKSGLDLAKANDWADALAQFTAALQELAQKRPDDVEAKARAQYNIAAVTMELGDLKKAMDLVSESSATKATDEARKLADEIKRRVEDLAKM